MVLAISVDELKRRFQERSSQFSWDSNVPHSDRLIPASVLVPIIPRHHGITVLLTRRTDHLLHHAGQISFPGGHQEPEDHSVIHTAVREAQEEVGIHASDIDVLGCMPALATPSGFRISPVVATLPADISFLADPHEVAECFEVPLSTVLNPASYQAHRMGFRENSRMIYAMPFQGRFIWGATALMLYMFMQLMSDVDR